MRQTFQKILASMATAALLLGGAPQAEAVPSLDYPGLEVPEEIVEVEIYVDGEKPVGTSPQAQTAAKERPEEAADTAGQREAAQAEPSQQDAAATAGEAKDAAADADTAQSAASAPSDAEQPSPAAGTAADAPGAGETAATVDTGTAGFSVTGLDDGYVPPRPGIQEVRLTAEEAARYGVNLEADDIVIPKVELDPVTGRYVPETEIVTEDIKPAVAPGNAKFFIKDIQLDASELKLKQEEVDAILAERIGKEATLAELNETVGKLTLYCRQHGYPASAAYLPVQESQDGVVQVKIIPGRYGEIRMHETGGLKESLMRSFTNGLRHGEIIHADELQTVLYSLSDLSGTKAVGILSAGKEFGTSDVTVRIEKGKTETTTLYAENYGSKSTGRYRYGLQHSRYDVGGTGARLNVGTLLSNQDLRNYYANYEMVVGHGGTTLGLGVSHMNYQTGDMNGITDLVSGDSDGKADTLSLFGSRTIRHTVNDKLRFSYGYDYRKLKDTYTYRTITNYPTMNLTLLNDGSYRDDKHSHSVHVGLDGYVRQPGSALTYGLTLTAGTMGGQRNANNVIRLYDQTTGTWGTPTSFPATGEPRGKGSFSKAEVNLNYVQSLGHSTDILFKLNSQLAGGPLDSSEQFYLGGANGVRAYPQGLGLGDSGWQGTAELRYHLPVKGLVLSTYLDTGHTVLKDGSGMVLKGWGIGLAYSAPGDWFARLDYARRIGWDSRISATNTDAKSKHRAWFILGKIW